MPDPIPNPDPNQNPEPTPEYEIDPLDMYSIEELVAALQKRSDGGAVIVGRPEGEGYAYWRSIWGDRWRLYSALSFLRHAVWRDFHTNGTWTNH